MKRFSTNLIGNLSALAVLIFTLTHCSKTFSSADSLPTGRTTAAQWQEIATEDGEFSVLMPSQPKIFVKDSLSFDGGIRLSNQRVYVVCGIGIAFVVELYDASSPAKGLKALLNIRSNIQTLQSDISLNGFNGQQYRRNWKDIYSSIQYFRGKKRIYVIQVIARDEKNPAVTQFLSSLRLGTNVGGVRHRSPDNDTFLPAMSSDNHVFLSNEVTRRAIPVWKPEPTYSAEGLKKNVKGNVLLQVVISSTGQVTETTVLKGLGHGLDEKAIEVAKATLFIPAERDGHVVSQYIKLEYNFDTGRK